MLIQSAQKMFKQNAIFKQNYSQKLLNAVFKMPNEAFKMPYDDLPNAVFKMPNASFKMPNNVFKMPKACHISFRGNFKRWAEDL